MLEPILLILLKNSLLQLIKFEKVFIRQFGIDKINSRSDPLIKVDLASAQLSYKS